jgi:hypothetical protein
VDEVRFKTGQAALLALGLESNGTDNRCLYGVAFLPMLTLGGASFIFVSCITKTSQKTDENDSDEILTQAGLLNEVIEKGPALLLSVPAIYADCAATALGFERSSPRILRIG